LQAFNTAEFKAELVAACQIPGSSIAAIAGEHGINANVLHRWLKEQQQSGRHQRIVCSLAAQSLVTSPPVPAFIAVKLPATATPEPASPDLIRVELRKGGHFANARRSCAALGAQRASGLIPTLHTMRMFSKSLHIRCRF